VLKNPDNSLHFLVSCHTNNQQISFMLCILQVDGMVCSGCSDRVLEALQKCDGVKNVAVDLESGLATIVLSVASQVEAFNTLPKLMDIVNELGFEAQPHFT
jgi:copper chaperone CopZ